MPGLSRESNSDSSAVQPIPRCYIVWSIQTIVPSYIHLCRSGDSFRTIPAIFSEKNAWWLGEWGEGTGCTRMHQLEVVSNTGIGRSINPLPYLTLPQSKTSLRESIRKVFSPSPCIIRITVFNFIYILFSIVPKKLCRFAPQNIIHFTCNICIIKRGKGGECGISVWRHWRNGLKWSIAITIRNRSASKINHSTNRLLIL